MQEILSGIHHWSAPHPKIKIRVSSYHLVAAGVVLDPIMPEDGNLDRLVESDPRPGQIVLTNRHHYRHGDDFREALGGIPVRVSRPGLHEFEGGPAVEPFEFGDELAPGVTAIEIGGICPDDTALHIDAAGGTIAIADAVIRPPGGGPLSFVPDQLMGDPDRDKRALRESLRKLLDHDFENLLLAHGEPVVGGGREALREFLDR
ncbi:MAG TPA: hypothetical protein VGR10_02765 [Thermoleophilaceae bacterium]|nr:hypothetical protein [Thermoleophilaceae bacterium]